MGRQVNRNFPGDSDCRAGLVTNPEDGDFTSHVCQNCSGNGCVPKAPQKAAAQRRRQLIAGQSPSYVLTDQRGNTVFVNLEKGTAYVLE